MTNGNANWLVTNGEKHAGTYSAASGNIGDSQVSRLEVDVVFSGAGTVEFWHKESTESNWDYLQFRIDGQLQDEWSGINNWAFESYNVAAGNHTFQWTYDKDGSLSSGSDTVWIDDITAG